MDRNELRETVLDELGVRLNAAEVRDVRRILEERDEDALLDFFGNIVEGGLTRDDCITVSNLLANYSECGRPGCVGYKPDGNHELAF